MCYLCNPTGERLRSLKDRITDSGSVGPGSIPSGGTKKAARAAFIAGLFL